MKRNVRRISVYDYRIRRGRLVTSIQGIPFGDLGWSLVVLNYSSISFSSWAIVVT